MPNDVLVVRTKLASTKLVQDEGLQRLLKHSGGQNACPSSNKRAVITNFLTIVSSNAFFDGVPSASNTDTRTDLVTHIRDVLDALFNILMSDDGDPADDDSVFLVMCHISHSHLKLWIRPY